MHAIHAASIEQRSQDARSLMLKMCPELVVAAEGLSQHVLYVPVSALGWNVSTFGELPTIRPADAEPFWVTVPLLYSLSKHVKGLIPRTA